MIFFFMFKGEDENIFSLSLHTQTEGLPPFLSTIQVRDAEKRMFRSKG